MNGKSYPVLYFGHLCLVLFIAGCNSLSRTELESAVDPFMWQPANVIQDVHQLAIREESGEPEDIIDYMAAQLDGVQPAFGDSLIFMSKIPQRVIQRAEFGSMPGSGGDFWPDPRSDSGFHTIGAMSSSDIEGMNHESAILVPRERLTSGRIDELVGLGTKVIFGVGSVFQRLASSVAVDALVMQVTSGILAKITGVSADSVEARMLRGATIHLPEPIRIGALIKSHDFAMNTMGFIAGQNPRYASQLIVITADPAWVALEKDSTKWMPAGVLSELARMYTEGNSQGAFPRRSLLVVSGTGAALHAVFDHPVWNQQKISAIITLGRSGNGFLELNSQLIPAFGYTFGKMHESEDMEVWITSVLEDIDGIARRLDGLNLEGES